MCMSYSNAPRNCIDCVAKCAFGYGDLCWWSSLELSIKEDGLWRRALNLQGSLLTRHHLNNDGHHNLLSPWLVRGERPSTSTHISSPRHSQGKRRRRRRRMMMMLMMMMMMMMMMIKYDMINMIIRKEWRNKEGMGFYVTFNGLGHITTR